MTNNSKNIIDLLRDIHNLSDALILENQDLKLQVVALEKQIQVLKDETHQRTKGLS